MATRPTLPNGFLGGQPRLGEVKMEVDSHKKAEFKVSGDNYEKIKFKTGVPVKVVTKLTDAIGDKEIQNHVLVQRQEGVVIFHVAFPGNSFYKFQIFALPESESTEQLPCVYNYLIEVVNNHKPTHPYAKAYTKFYVDSCYLSKPKYLPKDISHQDKVKFEVKVPSAKKVAVHVGEEWCQLEHKRGDKWEGQANLQQYFGKDTKVTVNGSYDDAGTSYSVLLEYNI